MAFSQPAFAGTKRCAEKAVSVLLANAVVEPFLRETAQNPGYSESQTTVGEGEAAVQEDYIFSVNEISSAKVSLLQDGCRLKAVELSVGE